MTPLPEKNPVTSMDFLQTIVFEFISIHANTLSRSTNLKQNKTEKSFRLSCVTRLLKEILSYAELSKNIRKSISLSISKNSIIRPGDQH